MAMVTKGTRWWSNPTTGADRRVLKNQRSGAKHLPGSARHGALRAHRRALDPGARAERDGDGAHFGERPRPGRAEAAGRSVVPVGHRPGSTRSRSAWLRGPRPRPATPAPGGRTCTWAASTASGASPMCGASRCPRPLCRLPWDGWATTPSSSGQAWGPRGSSASTEPRGGRGHPARRLLAGRRSPRPADRPGPRVLGTNAAGSLLYWRVRGVTDGDPERDVGSGGAVLVAYFSTWLDGSHPKQLTGPAGSTDPRRRPADASLACGRVPMPRRASARPTGRSRGRRGDRQRARLAHPPHRHAQMLGLDHHEHAARLERLDERVGDLGGQPLLHLRPLREAVDDPGELRQARDAAVVAGDVRDVRPPVERQRGDARRSSTARCRAPGPSRRGRRLREGRRDAGGSSCRARADLRVHLRDAARRAQQAVAVGVLADRRRGSRARAFSMRSRSSRRRRAERRGRSRGCVHRAACTRR